MLRLEHAIKQYARHETTRAKCHMPYTKLLLLAPYMQRAAKVLYSAMSTVAKPVAPPLISGIVLGRESLRSF